MRLKNKFDLTRDELHFMKSVKYFWKILIIFQNWATSTEQVLPI